MERTNLVCDVYVSGVGRHDERDQEASQPREDQLEDHGTGHRGTGKAGQIQVH